MRKLIMCGGLALALTGCSSEPGSERTRKAGGEWSSTTRVESVSFGDQYFEGSDLPYEFQGIQGEDTRCVKDRWASSEQLEEELEKDIGGNCSIDNFHSDDTSISGTGRCDSLVEASLDFEPTINFDGTMDGDTATMAVSFEGGAVDPDSGQRIELKILANVESRRLRDC